MSGAAVQVEVENLYQIFTMTYSSAALSLLIINIYIFIILF